ncbi:MAG TPA: DMT family transporter [Gammaproteobacteria bacterium]|nr:DMT family transporter [Gammaproteobacteria bacterium]
MSKTAQMIMLLILLVLIWGLSWPTMSTALHYCPAAWFSTIRLVISAVVIFAAFGATGHLILPAKKDIPLIISIGFFQIGLFMMLITLGLTYVEPGRSAIIAYLAPFFVTPIAVLFFGETLSKGKVAGLLLGAVGIILLFSPWELDWHNNDILLGNGLLLLSAIVWSGVMLHTRYATWHRESHTLLPWQFLVAIIPNLIAAVIMVPHPVIQWHAPLFIFCLLYSAILAGCVAYWLTITITRYLPVTTTSLALLAIPVAGLFASAIFVGEVLTASILISLAFIIAGLACVSVAKG